MLFFENARQPVGSLSSLLLRVGTLSSLSLTGCAIKRIYITICVSFRGGMAHPLSHIKFFLFDITATGVVSCGGPKTSSRTSSIVLILYFRFGPLRSARVFHSVLRSEIFRRPRAFLSVMSAGLTRFDEN